MSSYIVIKKTETQTALIRLCNDGIVRVLLKKDKEIGENELKENYSWFKELTQGKYYAFLYSTENNTVIYTAEGLKYAKENVNTLFPKICTAVVVKSLAHKLIANFYTRLLSRSVPHKMFNHYNEAEAWCLKLYQEYQHKANKPNFYSSVM